jgi:beta-lactamase superfamily II metal-dependent hydrolase
MFTVELLPAAHGDAIWIEYGDATKPRRIVIDGGPASSYENGLHRRLLRLTRDDRRIDLLVVTHIDSDHIDGSIILLRAAEELGLSFGEIWFNGWEQLKHEKAHTEGFQPLQGEFLNALLEFPRYRECWNVQSNGSPIHVPDDGALPAWNLPDNAKVTILSPGTRQINRLRARWKSALREFSPGDRDEALRRLEARREYRPPPVPPVFGVRSFGDDRSVANGSSISFLLEHDGISCLLAADAHPRVLAASLKRLLASRGSEHSERLRLDAFKLPHHGSLSNVNEEVLSLVDCSRWMISTNGAIYQHPDRQTAELIARNSREVPEFLCNYECETTLAFADPKQRWRTRYPDKSVSGGPPLGIRVDLAPPSRPYAKTPADGAARARRTASKRSRRS